MIGCVLCEGVLMKFRPSVICASGMIEPRILDNELSRSIFSFFCVAHFTVLPKKESKIMGKKVFPILPQSATSYDKNQWHDAKSMRPIIVQARARKIYI